MRILFKRDLGKTITTEDRVQQLRQRLSVNVEPHYNLSVVKINSTFMEIVDPLFGWRGAICALGLMITWLMGLGVYGLAYWGFIEPIMKHESLRWIPIIALFIVIVFLLIALFFLIQEAFAWTHYPMRLNRTTQKIHIFRPTSIWNIFAPSTVVTYDWKDVFFAPGAPMDSNNIKSIHGYILEDDGQTIKDIFTLPVGYVQKENVLRYWEFIRRYMEDGPKTLIDQIEICPPVNGCREQPIAGTERMFANVASAAPFPVVIILSPLLLFFSVGRWFAMWTSRIPRFPADIEATCQIEPNDPYVKDSRINPPWLQSQWDILRHVIKGSIK